MLNHATLSTNPARLLVADDDQLTLRFLADNLTADGYTVATAGSVGAARIVLEREPVDLIVIDVNGNTLPLLDALRAGDLHHVGAQTPVLVLTGHGEEQHRVRHARARRRRPRAQALQLSRTAAAGRGRPATCRT